MKRLLLASLVAAAIVVVAVLIANSPQRRPNIVRKHPVNRDTWPIPKGAKVGEAAVTIDGKHLAYTFRDSTGECLVFDGRRGKSYAAIRHRLASQSVAAIIRAGIELSTQGGRCGYVATEDRHAANDSRWGKDNIWQMTLSRSPLPGEQPVHVDERDWKQILVVDGCEFGDYDGIGIPVFSDNGKHWACSVRKEDKWTVLSDGREGKWYDLVAVELPSTGIAPRFSRNGEHLFYTALSQGKWRLVLDGKEEPGYADIRHLALSPDGTRYGYVGEINERKRTIVIDGKPKFVCQYVSGIQFSPDSRHWAACVAITYGHLSVVLDGKLGPDVKTVKSFGFTPDSTLLYRAIPWGSKSSFVYSGQTHSRVQKSWPSSDYVHSPNGKRLSFHIEQGMVYGIEYRGEFIKHADSPVFSPNSRRLAFIKHDHSKGLNRVEYDGSAGKWYSHVDPPVFSPDSNHIIYFARKGAEVQPSVLVIDEQETSTLAKPIYPLRPRQFLKNEQAPIFFDSADRFHYYELTDTAIKRKNISIPEALANREPSVKTLQKGKKEY